jgi:hypothetical protein
MGAKRASRSTANFDKGGKCHPALCKLPHRKAKYFFRIIG